MIPSCEPSGAITRNGLMRICRLTRTRFVLSWIGDAPNKKSGGPDFGVRQIRQHAPERVVCA